MVSGPWHRILCCIKRVESSAITKLQIKSWLTGRPVYTSQKRWLTAAVTSHKWLHFKGSGYFLLLNLHKLVYQETNFNKLIGPQDDLNTGKSSQRTRTHDKDIIAWTNGATQTETCSWLERETSWRKTREYLHVGLFGGEVAVFFAPAAAVTGDAAVVLGVAGLLLTVVLGVAGDGAFESEVRLSVVFASAT